MNLEDIRSEVAKRWWYHSVDLGNGIVTPGCQPANAWELYKMPESMAGKSVLDIGAWEGQFSFEAERRGAEKVLAIDVWGESDNPGSTGSGLSNFLFCHSVLGSNVQYSHRSVYDIDSREAFDCVFLTSVIYHLQDPFLGIRKAASVCRDLMVLETWVDCLNVSFPAMAFYEGKELAGDPTNWWGPNPACVEAMLRAAGFKRIEKTWSRPDDNIGGRGERVCWLAYKQG